MADILIPPAKVSGDRWMMVNPTHYKRSLIHKYRRSYGITYLVSFHKLLNFDTIFLLNDDFVRRPFLISPMMILKCRFACYCRDVGERMEWKFDKTELDSPTTPLDVLHTGQKFNFCPIHTLTI